MKGLSKWLTWTLLGGLGLHLLLVWLLPYGLMSMVLNGASRLSGVNAIYHAPKVTEQSRTVVRPAPDLAYSTCVFDLSEGALRVTMPHSQTYSSVSFFGDDTVNFFALNDRAVKGATQHIILMREGEHIADVAPDAIAVRAPSKRGLVLFRRVIPSQSAWPAIDAQRREADCQLIPD